MAVRIAAVSVQWQGGLRFLGGPGGGGGGGDDGAVRPPVLLDGDGQVATSPVEMLLVAAASCTAADVVLILQKQRVKLAALDVAVRGTRRETEPRRYTAIAFTFTVRGEDADDVKVRRAIDLSIEKYCSVLASLAPDIRITYDVAIG